MLIIENIPYLLLEYLVITLIIEVSIAFILKLKNKDILNVILVNLLTNPLLNALLFYLQVSRVTYYTFHFIVFEILIVFIEGFIYKKTLKYKDINPYLLSLILNVSSCLFGIIKEIIL